MKKILLASASLLTMVASASAADLYTKAPAYAAQVSNWTGFYVGLNAGYGGGESVLGFNPGVGVGAVDLNTKSNGFVGGGQIGYNWQVGQFLYGLEADIQGSTVKSSLGLGALAGGFGGGGAGFGDIGSTVDYFGTVRGRVGVMPWGVRLSTRPVVLPMGRQRRTSCFRLDRTPRSVGPSALASNTCSRRIGR